MEHIKAIYSLRSYYGYRRMTVALRHEGFTINHKPVYRLMRKIGIQSSIRKKRRYFGKVDSIIFPNLLKRDFNSLFPGIKLSTDITYLPTTECFIYFSVIQNLCNNEILSYSISSRNNLELVLSTLNKLSEMPLAILHSDQGFQYTHKAYQGKLSELQLVGSHSLKGNCLDNACIESFFAFKNRAIYQKTVNEQKSNSHDC